jgi:hypothetical protein
MKNILISMVAIMAATPVLAQADAGTTPIFDGLTHHNVPQPTWSPTPPRTGMQAPGDITNLGPGPLDYGAGNITLLPWPSNPVTADATTVPLPKPDPRLLHGHGQFIKNIGRLNLHKKNVLTPKVNLESNLTSNAGK